MNCKRSLLPIFITIVLLPGLTSALEWHKLELAAAAINQIVPDRRHDWIWYLTTRQNLNTGSAYVSRDLGKQWQRIPVDDVVQVSVHPQTSAVYVLQSNDRRTRSTVWLSLDLGKTFHPGGSVSGELKQLFLHPSDSRILFATSNRPWGVAASYDRGSTWFDITTFPFQLGKPYRSSPNCIVSTFESNSILFSPFDPKTIFVTGEVIGMCGPQTQLYDPLLLQRHSDGKSWQVVEHRTYQFHSDPLFPKRAFAFSGTAPWPFKVLTEIGWKQVSGLSFKDLVSIPYQRKGLFALKTFPTPALLHSADEGNTWTAVNWRFPKGLRTLAVTRNGTLFVAGEDGGLWRFRAGKWARSDSGIKEASVGSVQRAGNTLYASVSLPDGGSGLYKSNDLGATWRSMLFSLPRQIAASDVGLYVNPQNAQHLLASTRNPLIKGFLYVSKDGGTSWQNSGEGLWEGVFDPSDKNVVYFNWKGVFSFRTKVLKSSDGGLNQWELPLQTGFRLLTVDPYNSQNLFFGDVARPFAWRSTDGGNTIQSLPRPWLTRYNVQDIEPLPEPGSFLLLNTGLQVYKTSDGGSSWKFLSRIPQFVTRLHVASSTRFFAFGGGFYESIDAGKTWRNLSNDLDVRRLVSTLHMTDPRQRPIFLGTNAGIYRGE